MTRAPAGPAGLHWLDGAQLAAESSARSQVRSWHLPLVNLGNYRMVCGVGRRGLGEGIGGGGRLAPFRYSCVPDGNTWGIGQCFQPANIVPRLDLISYDIAPSAKIGKRAGQPGRAACCAATRRPILWATWRRQPGVAANLVSGHGAACCGSTRHPLHSHCSVTTRHSAASQQAITPITQRCPAPRGCRPQPPVSAGVRGGRRAPPGMPSGGE